MHMSMCTQRAPCADPKSYRTSMKSLVRAGVRIENRKKHLEREKPALGGPDDTLEHLDFEIDGCRPERERTTGAVVRNRVNFRRAAAPRPAPPLPRKTLPSGSIWVAVSRISSINRRKHGLLPLAWNSSAKLLLPHQNTNVCPGFKLLSASRAAHCFLD